MGWASGAGSSTSVEHTHPLSHRSCPTKSNPPSNSMPNCFAACLFRDNEVEIAKIITLEELKRLEDNPIQQAIYTTYEAGLGSPMGRIPLGETRYRLCHRACGRCVAIGMGIASHPICSLAWQAVWLPTPAMEAIGDVFGGWAGASCAHQKPHSICVADRNVQPAEKPLGTSPYLPALSQRSKGHALYYAGPNSPLPFSRAAGRAAYLQKSEKNAASPIACRHFIRHTAAAVLWPFMRAPKRTAPKKRSMSVYRNSCGWAKTSPPEELETRQNSAQRSPLHLGRSARRPGRGPRRGLLPRRAAWRTIDEIAAHIDARHAGIRFRNTPKHFPQHRAQCWF